MRDQECLTFTQTTRAEILCIHIRFLGNCPPTPPLSQNFALSEKQVLMLFYGRGRWAVSPET